MLTTISASGRSSAGIGIELTVLGGPVGGCIAGRERYLCFVTFGSKFVYMIYGIDVLKFQLSVWGKCIVTVF